MDKTESEIRVAPGSWGEEDVPYINAVLMSAGETLASYFPERVLPVIEVSRSTEGHPRTLHERGTSGEIQVKLAIEVPYWAQLAFQFGHEIGHILCGLATDEYLHPNFWFEQTICEVASLFVLGRMAETWKTGAPYPNWSDYAPALRNYRDARLKRAKLPEGTSLADMFREQEASLRKDSEQEDPRLTMAAHILPLFDGEPEHWEAVAYLNTVRGDGSRSFAQYLRDWSTSSPEKHREFPRQIAELFGVSLDL